MDNREQLELEIKRLEDEADYFRRHGNVEMCNNKLVEAMEKREELERLTKEAVIAEVTDNLTSSMETFSVGDITFTLEQLAIDADAANILRSGLQSSSKAQAQKFLDELSNQKSTHDMHLALKQEQVDNLLTERDTLQVNNAQLQLEKEDLTEKRDAAAQQLTEAQAEIARLNSHVDDLRKEIALGSTNTARVIDITTDAELEAAAQRLKAKKEQADAEEKAAKEAAKVRIYGVEKLDLTGSRFGAKRADNNEYITYGWLEEANFVILSEDEAARFRTELEAAKADIPEAEESVSSDLVVEQPTIEAPFRDFQSDTVQEYTTDGTVAEEATGSDSGTVEKRLAALEVAVFGSVKAAA